MSANKVPNGGMIPPPPPPGSNNEAPGGNNAPLPVNATALDRLRELEALFLGGPLMSSATNHQAKSFSTETLLDVLMVLYNECCNSSLRKEKTVSEFIEFGKNSSCFIINWLIIRFFSGWVLFGIWMAILFIFWCDALHEHYVWRFWIFVYLSYRLDIYELLNRKSSRIVRVAAASGLA